MKGKNHMTPHSLPLMTMTRVSYIVKSAGARNTWRTRTGTGMSIVDSVGNALTGRPMMQQLRHSAAPGWVDYA